MRGRHESIVGKRFGKIVVLEEILNKGTNALCKCKCDCGNVFTTRQYSITAGVVKSCGCIHRECISKVGKSNRKYENKCTECGIEEHYAKGLCRNCYARMKRKEQSRQCQEEKLEK